MQTSVWEQQTFNNPYKVFKHFFSENHLSDYKDVISELCEAAFSAQIWDKSSPGTVLHFIAHFESVINAAFVIDSEKRPVIHGNKTKSFKKTNLTLTPEEVKNPRSVFTSFFKKYSLKEWKIILARLMEYSLSKGTATGFSKDYPVIHIFKYLTKLVEAAFLIHKHSIKK